jgi:hypothetical protein
MRNLHLPCLSSQVKHFRKSTRNKFCAKSIQVSGLLGFEALGFGKNENKKSISKGLCQIDDSALLVNLAEELDYVIQANAFEPHNFGWFLNFMCVE